MFLFKIASSEFVLRSSMRDLHRGRFVTRMVNLSGNSTCSTGEFVIDAEGKDVLLCNMYTIGHIKKPNVSADHSTCVCLLRIIAVIYVRILVTHFLCEQYNEYLASGTTYYPFSQLYMRI